MLGASKCGTNKKTVFRRSFYLPKCLLGKSFEFKGNIGCNFLSCFQRALRAGYSTTHPKPADRSNNPTACTYPRNAYFHVMHIESKLTPVGAGGILLVDTISSLLSVHFHVSYALLCLGTLALYFGLTYWAAKHLNLRATLAFGAFLGLVDVTIGCKLSSWLGADPDQRLQKITMSTWFVTVVMVMVLGAFIALVSFLIASYRNKRESR
jgi:hypothetical protein